MVNVLHTVIQTILYVRSSEVRNLYHARDGLYHHRVASKVIVRTESTKSNLTFIGDQDAKL
jgi:hypothetical protein